MLRYLMMMLFVGWLSLPGLAQSRQSVEDLLADANAWDVTAKRFASKIKKVDGQPTWFLRSSAKHPISARYKTPVTAWGTLRWSMLQPDANEKAGMFIVQLHGMTDSDDQPMVVRITPAKLTAQLGKTVKQWESVFEDLGAELQWSLGFNDQSKHIELKLGDETLIQTQAKWDDPNLTLQIDVTRGPLTVSQMQWVTPNEVQLAAQRFTDITLDTSNAKWLDLPSSWKQYMGIHYTTRTPGQGWSTVRGYGSPHLGPPGDGKYRKDATQRTGPFDEQTIRLDLQDIGRQSRLETSNFKLLLPRLKADGLDAIYQGPIRLIDKQSLKLDKNLAYWTIRLTCEWDRQYAADHVFWQWGNEINGLHLDLFDDKAKVKAGRSRWAFSNQPEKADAYAEYVLAPAIEVMRRVGQDVYGDPKRLPIVCGSLGNSYNSKARAWLDRVLKHKITGTHAPSLAGKRILDFVDIICVHYPVASDPYDKTLGQYHADYFQPGHVKGIWVTESHGRRGRGTATILMRGMRFLQWAANYQLNRQQTRICWWGTSKPKPGGKADIAIDQLGDILGDIPLKMSVLDLPDEQGKVYLLLPSQSQQTMQCFMVIAPQKQHALSIGSLHLPNLSVNWDSSTTARLIEYSTEHQPTQRDLTAEHHEAGGITFKLDAPITGFAILTLMQQQ